MRIPIRQAIVLLPMLCFAALSSTHAHAGGTLSNGIYSDDFQGGPLIPGWLELDREEVEVQPGVYETRDVWRPATTTTYFGAAYLGTQYNTYAFQMPTTVETFGFNATNYVQVAFDYEYYDGLTSCDTCNPVGLNLEFFTVSSGVPSPTSLTVPAKKLLYRSGEKWGAIVPLSSIPKVPGTIQNPNPAYSVGLRITNFDSYYHTNTDIRIDNFKRDTRQNTSDIVSWDFNSSQLPPGWVTEGYVGRWVKSRYNFDTRKNEVFGGLAAVHDGSPAYVSSPGSQPDLRIDAWSSEIRFTNLALAALQMDIRAFADFNQNDTVMIDLYRTNAPVIPAQNQPALASLFNFKVSDISDIGTTALLTLNIMQDALGGNEPNGHTAETVYRIRTRVYDNDVQLNSFDYVEIDNFKITYAVLNLRGDYNNDGVVDGGDFLVWQRALGSSSGGAADGNGDGVINMLDLDILNSNLGKTRASLAATAAVQAGAPVPEPTALTVAMLGGIAASVWRRKRRRHPCFFWGAAA